MASAATSSPGLASAEFLFNGTPRPWKDGCGNGQAKDIPPARHHHLQLSVFQVLGLPVRVCCVLRLLRCITKRVDN